MRMCSLCEKMSGRSGVHGKCWYRNQKNQLTRAGLGDTRGQLSFDHQWLAGREDRLRLEDGGLRHTDKK